MCESKQTARARSIGFFAVSALAVLAAGVSTYLELRIRSTATEIERLRSNPASIPGVAGARSARDAKQAPDGRQQTVLDSEPVARDGWKWVLDGAQMEREAKQAMAAIGYDRALDRGAANQIRVRLRFHELYKILGLSEAEIAAFEMAAADENLTFNQLLSPDEKAAEAHERAQANSMDRIVENTLGRDYVEPFRMFLATSDLRDMMAELAAFSLSTGQPLNSGQAATLLQTCLELRQTKDGATRIDLAQIDWESVAIRSQNFLTPAQQKLLHAMIDWRNFDRTFQDITGLPLHRPIRGLRSP